MPSGSWNAIGLTEFGRSEPRDNPSSDRALPLPFKSPEVRTETRWTKEEIPFSKAQLKYLCDLRSDVASNGGEADGK
jgi:hypothetical protein